jgi:hypothetical protein
MQAVSWCFAVDHLAGEDHTIDRPEGYAHWRDHRPSAWTGPLLSLTAPVPRTSEPLTRTFTPNPPNSGETVVDHRLVGGDNELWAFRRIADRRSFAPGHLVSDITLVNWPMVDYFEGPVYGEGPVEAERHLRLPLDSPTVEARCIVTDHAGVILYVGEFVYPADVVQFDVELAGPVRL